MSGSRVSEIAAPGEDVRPLSTGLVHSIGTGLQHVGQWAGNTAQQLGELLAALMGPAVVCAYAFTLWSLAQNLGWTSTFIFHSGPFSNFFIWLLIAALVSIAAAILSRRIQLDKPL